MKAKKVEGSDTGHCCFQWTVFGYDGHSLAECFDEDDADTIVNALNDAERYRFLRDRAGISFQVTMEMRREPSEWDEAIDEEMKEQSHDPQ